MQTAAARRRARLRRRAVAAIARDYRRPLTVAALAGELRTSPRTLQRALGPRDDHRRGAARARLGAAAQLLAEQPIAVADVGRIVGYRNPSAFAAAFARRYGLAPAAYRAAVRAARHPAPPSLGRRQQP